MAPDYETPQDSDTDNAYQLDIKAEDAAGNTATQAITITVTDLDEVAPTLISESSITVSENKTGTIYTAEADESVTFSLGTAKDESAFELTGAQLSFTDIPDFENPFDEDGDNEYLLDLLAEDAAGNQATFALFITVTDVDEAGPVFTSEASIEVAENSTGTIYTVEADEASRFILGSDKDESLFDLNDQELAFTMAPDFEQPLDANEDNQYELDLVAEDDAGNRTVLAISITVTDQDETAPVFLSETAIVVEENSTGTVYTVEVDEAATFVLGTDKDESSFVLTGAELAFVASPDHENPLDGDGDNAYLVDILATDAAGNVATLEVTVTVSDVDEIAPEITSDATVEVEENSSGSFYQPTANEAVTFALGQEKDESAFDLSDTEGLSFVSAPDFEQPTDQDEDNVYLIDLIAVDASGNQSTLELAITVTDLEEENEFSITSPSSTSFEENSTAVAYVISSNASNPTYRLGTELDESLFVLEGDQVSFITSPDFETPLDTDLDNDYEIEVIVVNEQDQTNSKRVTITVTDVAEEVILSLDQPMDFEVYPNPVSDLLNIDLPDVTGFRNLSLLDLNGRLHQSYAQLPLQLDISSLKPGVYLIRLETEQGVFVRSLVKR